MIPSIPSAPHRTDAPDDTILRFFLTLLVGRELCARRHANICNFHVTLTPHKDFHSSTNRVLDTPALLSSQSSLCFFVLMSRPDRENPAFLEMPGPTILLTNGTQGSINSSLNIHVVKEMIKHLTPPGTGGRINKLINPKRRIWSFSTDRPQQALTG